MDLHWLDPEQPDRGDIAAAVALIEAARAIDAPHELSPTTSSFHAQLRHGWDGDPSAWALVRDHDGNAVAVLEVNLPVWDNTHVGFIDVIVEPSARRQGVARQLFGIGVEKVREAGRTLVLAEAWDGSAGAGFLKAMGLDPASDEVKREIDLTSADWKRLDEAYEAARQRAVAYELVRIPGATPEHLLADIVALTQAINDAPTDDLDIEDEVFSPERIRAFEAAQVAYDRRIYRLVARESDTGDLAGHTMVGVENERPWHGRQYDTSVLRTHRGHRLGMLLKIGMLHWLREAEPQLRTVSTWNAASNAHMIQVNEAVGYHVIANAIVWQRHM